MAIILLSTDFKKAVSDEAYSFFETSFQKFLEQFEETGLIPEDREDLSNFDKAIATLPNKEDVEETKGKILILWDLKIRQ